jgi:hypothetical protein
MYKLVFTVALGIALIVGYQQYSHYQQQSAQARDLKDYEMGKQALENARVTKSPQPLDQFIRQHPDSDWVDTAVYYRDKFALQQIVETRDTAKLKQFIKHNSDSEWQASAQQHLIKIQREQENREIQQRILNNQPEMEISGNIPSLDAAPSSTPAQSVQTKTPARSTNTTSRNESAERVRRALSIYQTMSKPNIAQNEMRKKQQQQEERRLRACNRLKDQLVQFKKSRRTRWYDLDDTGERVYMSKPAVAQRKKEIRSQIERNCS